MNRELKYKVTGYNAGEIYDVDSFELNTSVGPIAITENEGEFRLNDKDDVYLLEYTNCKTKDGVEIYTGYLVLIPDEYPQSELEPTEPFNHIGVVEFRDGSYGFAWTDDKYKTPKEMWMSFHEYETEIDEISNIEIVGTILDLEKWKRKY